MKNIKDTFAFIMHILACVAAAISCLKDGAMDAAILAELMAIYFKLN